MQKRLFIIAGCNGAGKTTTSFRILPELLNCKEFVNADEIARGISPFQPEKVALEAGRIMLSRIHELIEKGEDFAFETTLATKSYLGFIDKARENGFHITLVFFWLNSPDLAITRVAHRVNEGGHNIPIEVIKRRYSRGLKNLFSLYFDKVDYLLIFDNSDPQPELIAEKETFLEIVNVSKFKIIKSMAE